MTRMGFGSPLFESRSPVESIVARAARLSTFALAVYAFLI